MILASSLAVRGGVQDFFAGNAKIYDGVFDYDRGLPNFSTSSFGDFSCLLSLRVDSLTKNMVPFEVASGASGFFRVFFVSGFYRLVVNNTRYQTTTKVTTNKSVLIVTFDASTGTPAFYFDGVPQPFNALDNPAPPYSILPNTIDIGRAAGGGFFFEGVIKQAETIDRIATAQEIADASSLISGGSFRASGIAHNSGGYLTAIDFDKINGNPPTTFASTPSYTFTSFGGAEYVDYPSL